jgi:hypothetical protein
MKSPFSMVLICVAMLVAGSVLASTADAEPRTPAGPQNLGSNRQPVTIQYFLSQPIYRFDGHENRDFGEFRVCVNIFEAHGHRYIFLWNVMTYFDRWLVIKPVSLEKRSSGKFDFKFTDNWENEGTGSIEYLSDDRIRVDIKSTRPSDEPPNRNILGQYGTQVLSKAACPHERFLEGAVP